MIEVSDGLRKELDSQIRQNLEYEAVISLVDKNTGFEVEYNKAVGSLLDDICHIDGIDGVSWLYEYHDKFDFKGFADFEQNAYDTLNPKRLFRQPTQEEIEQPWMTEEYANKYASRVYSKEFYYVPTTEANPFFDCEFDLYDPLNITGLTFVFGEDSTIYPTKLVIEIYDSLGNLISKTTENPKSVYFSTKKKAANVGKIKLKVLEMSRTEVKFRMSSALLGYEESFKDNLISIQCKRSSNPLSTELPRNKVSVSLYDFDGTFDAQNPNGLYFFLLSAEIQIYCTYNGIRSLFGTYNAYESPTSSGHTVSFDGESIGFGELQRFENKCFGYNGASLHDLLVSDTVPIRNVITNLELDLPVYNEPRNYEYVEDKFQKAYSKVSNCIFGMFLEDELGNITLRSSLKPNEEPQNVKELKDELICGEIKVDTSTPIPSGIKINMYEAGTGKKLNAVGEGNFVVDNNYVIGEDIAQYMTDTYNWWVDGTQKYEISYMADPTLEIGDFVKFKNKYGVELVGIIAENNYSLPTQPSSDNLVIYTIQNKR